MKTDPHTPLLRVGVLGCGMISADHLRAWARCTGAAVVAVCDPQQDRAEGRAREFGIPASYTSPAAMFAAEALDLVDIITSRQTHADMVRLAAKHKVHALCEKPLCPTLAEAESLVREVGEEQADQMIAYTQKCTVVPLDTTIALLAADLHREHKLATADAIVYATALSQQAKVLTCDAHFKGLPDVLFLPKLA